MAVAPILRPLKTLHSVVQVAKVHIGSDLQIAQRPNISVGNYLPLKFVFAARSAHSQASDGKGEQMKVEISPSRDVGAGHFTLQESTSAIDSPGSVSCAIPDAVRENAACETAGHIYASDMFDGISPFTVICKVICYTHEFTDLPWILSISAVVIAIRILFLPLDIYANSIRMKSALHSNSIRDMVMAISKFRSVGDPARLNEAQKKLEKYRKEHNIPGLSATVSTALFRMAVPLYFLMTIRRLSDVSPPGYTSGGFLWFSDLSKADPTFIIPTLVLITSLIFNTVRTIPSQYLSCTCSSLT